VDFFRRVDGLVIVHDPDVFVGGSGFGLTLAGAKGCGIKPGGVNHDGDLSFFEILDQRRLGGAKSS
jgi:hypothetical protein